MMQDSCMIKHIIKITKNSDMIFLLLLLNQRTNGPVNAHLISGPTIHTKTSFAKFDIVLKWVKVNSGSSFILTLYSLST